MTTKTAQFTPGPWVVRPDSTIESKDGVTIASFVDNEADMPLIAAAPAMYEALKGLISEINLSKLNIRKDFSLINAHAYAVKTILQAEGKLL